jgi:predicted signal transduction protein with EAL and GGDEF domain
MVIAEGVAQPAELAVAEDAGASLIQGELLGRAMPAERLEAMLSGDVEIRPPRPRAHDMGRLDSGREMRQS